MPMHNYSFITFPPLLPESTNASKELMDICVSMGRRVPPMMKGARNGSMVPDDKESNPIAMLYELLSSYPHELLVSPPSMEPNDTMELNYEMDWNITEILKNCSYMPCMIDKMRNSSDDLRCFMQAFMAPYSWRVLMDDGPDMDLEDFKMLLWAAKPFMQYKLPPYLDLPTKLGLSQIVEMANMLSEVYDSMTQSQSLWVHKWIKDEIRPWKSNCSMKPLKPGPRPGKGPKEGGKGEIPRPLGKMFLKKLKMECFNRSSEFIEELDRMGNLACYFDNPKELNSSMSTSLLPKLKKCKNFESEELKKELSITIVSSSGKGPLPASILTSVAGSAASVLSLSMLNELDSSVIEEVRDVLVKTKWSRAQARVLAKKLLKETKNVSGRKLMKLGEVMGGVSIDVLEQANITDLLGKKDMDTFGWKLSKLQRAVVMEKLRRDMKASELVRRITGPLTVRLSLYTIQQAGLKSVDELEGKNWTRSQSALLVSTILVRRMRPEDIKKLNSAVQGVTCAMIRSTDSDVLEVAQALTRSMDWLSRTQVCCTAKKLYSSLEMERNDFFSNITHAELKAIPTPLLIHMPETAIMSLPNSVCSCFLDKMSEANLCTLPLSSALRPALTNRALGCLGKNASDLSSDDIPKLGPLVCELSPSQLSSLAANTKNATLRALAKCNQINPKHKRAIITMLKEQYGEPSNWSSSTTEDFGRLLLLDDDEIRSLTYKTWLKAALVTVVNSLPPSLSETAPEEYLTWPNLAVLREKCFNLTTYSEQSSPATRRKRMICENPPSLTQILTLGNDNRFWSAEQLACMSAEVFSGGVQILGRITTWSPEQLNVLWNKVVEVFGTVNSLAEAQVQQLGCLSQALPSTELRGLNITSLETVEVLRKCVWTQEQREEIRRNYANHAKWSVAEFGNKEIVGLFQFICGLNLEELRDLRMEAFREAVSDIGEVSCPSNAAVVLKDKAVLVFGKPEGWTEAEVSSMGNIIAGLSKSELKTLKNDVLPFISPSAIHLIDPKSFAGLSVDQLLALGPDNAAMVTDDQKSELSEEQREALKQTLGVPYIRIDTGSQSTTPASVTPDGSGASRVGIVRTLVFLQQFIFLALWYSA
ncbi:hypothetical protein GJAV_G00007930 [Gymnothorax javanicus]|nr:hypothetical protein GJAV_G00007930 [Gymnothorax javanicus]